ncbi:MAG: ParA family protein [Candidatus Dormibacteria bacterium]
MGRILAIANQKGGVGKSTTTLNLAWALRLSGRRVLAIDLDPQAHLTLMSGVAPEQVDRSVHHLMLEPDVGLDQVVVTLDRGPDLLPANIHLAGAELDLGGRERRELRLRDALVPARSAYDYILIDCPPNLGMLTINALTAADGVIVPLQLEFLALKGLQLLLGTIDQVNRTTNPDLRLEGILPTMQRGRSLHSQEVLDRVREHFRARVYRSVIRASIRFPEASAGALSIFAYDPGSPGAQAYRDLAAEVLGEEAAGVA